MKHREVFFLFGLTKIVHPSSDVLFPTPLLHLPHFICSSKKGKEKKKGRKSSVQENESVSRGSSKGRGYFLPISLQIEFTSQAQTQN